MIHTCVSIREQQVNCVPQALITAKCAPSCISNMARRKKQKLERGMVVTTVEEVTQSEVLVAGKLVPPFFCSFFFVVEVQTFRGPVHHVPKQSKPHLGHHHAPPGDGRSRSFMMIIKIWLAQETRVQPKLWWVWPMTIRANWAPGQRLDYQMPIIQTDGSRSLHLLNLLASVKTLAKISPVINIQGPFWYNEKAQHICISDSDECPRPLPHHVRVGPT